MARDDEEQRKRELQRQAAKKPIAPSLDQKMERNAGAAGTLASAGLGLRPGQAALGAAGMMGANPTLNPISPVAEQAGKAVASMQPGRAAEAALGMMGARPSLDTGLPGALARDLVGMAPGAAFDAAASMLAPGAARPAPRQPNTDPGNGPGRMGIKARSDHQIKQTAFGINPNGYDFSEPAPQPSRSVSEERPGPTPKLMGIKERSDHQIRQTAFGINPNGYDFSTPEQPAAPAQTAQTDEQRRAAEAKRGAATIQQTRANVGNTLDRLGNSAVNLANQPGRIAIEGAKQIGGFLGNTTFDSDLPDYSNQGLRQRKAENWVKANPAEAASAKQGLADVADRAVAAAQQPFNIPRPIPSPGDNLPVASPAQGAQPMPAAAPQTIAGQPAAQPGSPAQSQPSNPAQPQDGNGWSQTGIGEGQQGGQIVGRMGAGGVPEFSNDAGAQQGASAMPTGGLPGARARNQTQQPGDMTAPAGSRVLASGTNAPRGDVDFARLGSAANIGNGVGTFSQMQEGDSQLALDRFGRANEIRAGMRRDQPRELGDTGNFRVVGDSSTRQGRADNERRELAREERRTEDRDFGLRAQTADREQAMSEQELGLRGREAATAEQQAALEGQRAQQEIEAGDMTLAQQRQLADLYGRYQAAAPEERAELAEQINLLSGRKDTAMKPRDYVIKQQVPVYDAQGNPTGVMQDQLIDGRNNQVIEPQGQGAQRRTTVTRAEVEQTAREEGITPEQLIKNLQTAGVSVNG